jgi:hypothetical protein
MRRTGILRSMVLSIAGGIRELTQTKMKILKDDINSLMAILSKYIVAEY